VYGLWRFTLFSEQLIKFLIEYQKEEFKRESKKTIYFKNSSNSRKRYAEVIIKK